MSFSDSVKKKIIKSSLESITKSLPNNKGFLILKEEGKPILLSFEKCTVSTDGEQKNCLLIHEVKNIDIEKIIA